MYYGFLNNNIAIINDNIAVLNALTVKYLNNILLTIDLKGLKSLNKTTIWKSYFVLLLFLGKKPKILKMVFKRAYKDTLYRLIIYNYISKKNVLAYVFNTVFLIRLTCDVLVYNHAARYSITFKSLLFIKNFELNSELYNWSEPINLHLLFPQEGDYMFKKTIFNNLKIKP